MTKKYKSAAMGRNEVRSTGFLTPPKPPVVPQALTSPALPPVQGNLPSVEPVTKKPRNKVSKFYSFKDLHKDIHEERRVNYNFEMKESIKLLMEEASFLHLKKRGKRLLKYRPVEEAVEGYFKALIEYLSNDEEE